jgi:predicted nuclease of predicted toxin-antitoxin system
VVGSSLSTVGEPTADDTTLMRWAVTHGYIVFTHDLDFGAILATTRASAPSVIQLRVQNILPDQLAKLVIAAIHQFEHWLRQGALIVVDPKKSRVRILPLIQTQN